MEVEVQVGPATSGGRHPVVAVVPEPVVALVGALSQLLGVSRSEALEAALEQGLKEGS